MAELGDLRLKVTADINDLLNGMNKGSKSLQDFKDQLGRFKTALDNSTDPASIIRLTRAIEATQEKIKLIQGAGTTAAGGLNKVKDASNTAGQSLINLGRIAQDAPFGFIGITNNINPLLESFQRLQAESKATGTSLVSNLKGALLGGAGIGLAVSVVTGLLTLMSQGLFKNKEQADAFARSLVDVNLELERSKQRISDFTKEAANLKALEDINLKINFASDDTRSKIGSRQDSILAMETLQKLLKEEERLFNIANQASGRFFDNASNKAKTLAASFPTFADISESVLEDLNKSDKSLINAAIATGKALVDVQNKIADQRNAIAIKQRTVTATSIEIDRKAAKEAAELAKEQAKKYAAWLEALRKFQAKLKAEYRFAPDIAPIDETQLAKDVEEAFDKIKNKNAATIQFPVKIEPTISTDNLRDVTEADMIAQLKKAGIKSVNLRGQKIPVEGLLSPDLKKVFEDFKQKAKDGFAQMEDFLVTQATNVFTTFAGAVGEAMLGTGMSIGDIFSGFFSSILSSLGDGIRQLGIQAVAASKLIMAIRATLGTPKGLLAGLGLVVLGTVIKGLAARMRMPAFANGTSNFAGGMALVGERGPELVRLPSGSDVIPNHQLSGMSIGGGQAIQVYGEFEMRGDRLVAMVKRGMSQISRNS